MNLNKTHRINLLNSNIFFYFPSTLPHYFLFLALFGFQTKHKKNEFLMSGFIVDNLKKIKHNKNSLKFFIFVNFLILI